MMKIKFLFMKIAVLGLCLSGAFAAVQAGELLFAPVKVTDWLWNYKPDQVSVAEENGVRVFRAYGYRQLFSVRTFPVKSGVTYRLKGEFRAEPGSIPAKFYFGFAPQTRRKLPINSPTVNQLAGSETTLLADVSKTDQVIRLALPEKKWLPGGYVVFGARKDLSDLPNFSFSRGVIKDISCRADCMVLTLARPCGRTAGKGTLVREHIPGGNYHYAGALNETAPGEWTQFQGTVEGFAVRGGLPRDQWWAGTEQVAVMILANYRGPREAVLEFRNIEFEQIEKEN